MFPIRDHNPTGRTPFVTYAIIAANIVVFLSYLSLQSNPAALQGFFLDWAVIPAAVSNGQGLHALVSSMFLHGGWMHLIGNMLFLFIFGDNVEDQLGHAGFALFYLACGIGAGLMQVYAAPSSTIPLVGASGAIAGVMGGYLLMFPRARVDLLIIIVIIIKIIPVPAWAMLILWLGIQVFSGLSAPADVGGVAYWAHTGGFILGLGLMLPVWLARGGPLFWKRTHGHPAHAEARYAIGRSRIPNVKRGARPNARTDVPVVRRRK